MISVDQIDNTHFRVTVTDSTTTTHQVALSDDYYKKLTSAKISKEELIKRSFEFLLKHESNTMILSSFDLPIIQTYFSNYEGAIQC